MFGRKPAQPKSAPQVRAEGGSLARMVNSAGRVDLTLLQRWILQWRGLGVSFEIVPVVPSRDTRAVVEPHLD